MLSKVAFTETVEFPSRVEFDDEVELLLSVGLVLLVVAVLVEFVELLVSVVGAGFGLGGAPQNFLTMS